MGEVLVLCYHAVSPSWQASLSITPAALRSQLQLLVERGYEGAGFHEAVSYAPAERTLVVSFDDAYKSVFQLGAPILAELGLIGTVFAPSAFMGTDRPMSWDGIDQWLHGDHRQELAPMSWEELRGLADRGWEIGSHTCTHPRLPDLDDESLDRELRRSKERCEQAVGRPCRSIAYPYGAHDARVVHRTRAAGYEAAATLSPRLPRAEALRWPRVGIYHSDSTTTFRAKVSPVVRRLRTSPFADPVAALRQLARRG